ncbi:long-chain-fatty-acid--CoA ligase [Sphingobium estronivorans]|uniref:long-chain-fatty-acid--CoA ligase n=1 Tax=Sphingobium estronivorans TaxID=1577690 RepID=UPI00123B1840|nr:long-chain-fatty-acid--CoA ligase [Sphingobium estronivorans]
MYLTQGLHRCLQKQPDTIATIAGERRQTYRMLALRVAKLAGAFGALGIARGDRIAYLGLNSDCYTEFYFATFWAGAVVNPVNTRWNASEIAYALNDSGSRVLLADAIIVPMLDEIRAMVPDLRHIIWIGDSGQPDGTLDYEALIDENLPVPDVRCGGEALAGLFYTGGTTGFPKGVMLTHRNLVTSALGAGLMRFIHPATTFLHAAPMFHAGDFSGWLITAVTGGTHVTVPAFSPQAVLSAIEAHRVTDTILVPTMLQMLVDARELKDFDLSSLRHIGYGGSPVSDAILMRAQQALPGVALCQAYGQTELSTFATMLMPEEHIPGSPRLRSAGRAVVHAEVGVVDADDHFLPAGKIGEIVARGGHMMVGYWNKPEETALALRNGWLHTGDMGRLDDDGYLYIVDRLKDMIITGGENVFSTEVENALARHPAVAACAVIGLPDEKWGERVHAAVVLKHGTVASAGELRDHVKTLIAGYKCPQSIDIVDALPVSGTGKVLKRALRERHLSRTN